MPPLLSGLAVFAVLVLRQRFANGSKASATVYAAGVAALCLAEGIGVAQAFLASVRRPPEYDFVAFWLFGRVALLYHDVYDPRFFHALGDALHPSADFSRELLDVGCVYPPPGVAWFLPLGASGNIHGAVAAWSIAGVLVMIAALVCIWRLWDDAPTALDFGLVIVLAFSMHGTTENAAATQLIYLALLWVALAMRGRTQFARGLALGLALTVKPFLALMLAGPLLRREWRALLGACSSVLILCVLVLPVIGPATFLRYVRNNPISRFPPWLYTELTNQSILSWMLRLRHSHPAHVAFGAQLPYLAVAALILAITFAVTIRAGSPSQSGTAFYAVTGMLVYPQILTFYPVLLLAAFAVLWRRRAAFPGRDASVAAFIGLDVILGNFYKGYVALLAVALGWLALLALTYLEGKRTRSATAIPH